jgi:diguanylate cyclase (GGDEF)-like protein/PAS domain S-box-containing protein
MKRAKNPPQASAPKKKARRPTNPRTSDEGERSYHDLLLRLPVGVYRTTPKGRILGVNPALGKMLGYTPAQLKRKNVEDFYLKRSDRDRYLDACEQKSLKYVEFPLRRKDGHIIWGRDYSRPKRGADGRIEFFDGILVDITQAKATGDRLKKAQARLRATTLERKQMIKKLENLSITDDLTGIFNRRGFRLFAQQYLSIAVRRKSLSFLLYLDLDNLKRINDVFGHHVGDEALIRMASILKATFRESDIKGRMGGDEFGVFPIDSTPEGMDTVLARLRRNLEAANQAPDAVFKLSVSAGIAAFDPEQPSTIEELLVQADTMMYEEKRNKERQ